MKFKIVKDGKTILIGTFPDDMIALDEDIKDILEEGDVQIIHFDDRSYSKGYTDGYIDGERDCREYNEEVERLEDVKRNKGQ